MFSPQVIINEVKPEPLVQLKYTLPANFDAFFKNINPAQTWKNIAASQYNSIASILENDPWAKENLAIKCLVQGSYDRHTAIHSINDIDIVAICTNLHYPPRTQFLANGNDRWDRNRIFSAIENLLCSNVTYKNALVPSNPNSMCVKLNLGIKVEILPVVRDINALNGTNEPFYLWRPANNRWEPGYAQEHQKKLSEKNIPASQVYFGKDQVIIGTAGNFIPAIKIYKHLAAITKLDIVSFHLECLLHSIPDKYFWGSPPAYILQTLYYISQQEPIAWYQNQLKTPCADRNIFTSEEWNLNSWLTFHKYCRHWYDEAFKAVGAISQTDSIKRWSNLLGSGWFPLSPAT